MPHFKDIWIKTVMLQRIVPQDLRLGMFVHKLEGHWFSHPFWRARFRLEDQAVLDQLRHSRVRAVVIDTSRGDALAEQTRAVDPPAPVPAPERAPVPATEAQPSRLDRLRARHLAPPPAPALPEYRKHVAGAAKVVGAAERAVEHIFADARLGKAVPVRQVKPVVASIMDSIRKDSQAFNGLMRCKLNNRFAYRHAIAVSGLMISLARAMRMPVDHVRSAGMAGLFLDYGANYLPLPADPAGDDPRQAEGWESHVALDYRALNGQKLLAPDALSACLQHHERMDGSGFPNGLAGEGISLFGRMAAICDEFDFLLCGCGQQPGLDPAEAVDRLRQMTGAFDADILQRFIESVGFYPVGSFVRLRSNRIAMVVHEDPDNPACPIVQPFYSLETGGPSWRPRLALATCFGEDAITGIADLTGLPLPEISVLREQVFMRSVGMA